MLYVMTTEQVAEAVKTAIPKAKRETVRKILDLLADNLDGIHLLDDAKEMQPGTYHFGANPDENGMCLE